MRQLFLLVCALSGLTSFAQPGRSSAPVPHSATRIAPLVLEDERVKIAFDSLTGALVEFTAKTTGWTMHRRPALGESFRMLVPLPGRRDNEVLGSRQRLKSYRFSPGGHELDLVWEGLISEKGGRLPIAFFAHIALQQGEVSFTGRIVNRSPYTIETLSYPCLGDVPIPPGDERLLSFYKGYGDLTQSELLPQFNSWRGYWGTYNPVQLLTTPHQRYVLVGGTGQGLYVGCHDTTFRAMLQYQFALQPGWPSAAYATTQRKDSIGDKPLHLTFSTTHFLFVNPQQTARLLPVVLKPYQGNWRAGTELFRTWQSRHAQPAPTVPAWATGVHSWLQVQLNGAEDELRFTYKDLVDIGRECAQHGIGAIQVVGWNNGGQDRGNPFHDTDPRLGTWQDLHEAIAQVEAMGVRVILFAKFVWADRTTDWYRRAGYRLATKDPYGDAHFHAGYEYFTTTQLADLNTRRFAPLCVLNPAYQAMAAGEFTKLIKLGASGMLYDEHRQHGAGYYCFDPAHHHAVPAFIVPGDTQLMNKFGSISQQRKPDFLLAGEDLNGQQSDDLGVTYLRINPDHQSWLRVMDPLKPVLVAVNGFDDRELLNLCLLYRYLISYEPYNFKGRLADFPLTLTYGKQVDALRRRYKPWLWDALYQAQSDVTATAEGKPYTRLAVYKQPVTGKRAVVLINNNQTLKPLPVTLTIPARSASTRLRLVSPENPDGLLTDGSFIIPARSAVVVLEE